MPCNRHNVNYCWNDSTCTLHGNRCKMHSAVHGEKSLMCDKIPCHRKIHAVTLPLQWHYIERDVRLKTPVSRLFAQPLVQSGADQRNYESSALLACVRGIHRWPVDSPHKAPVTRNMFPFDNVIMAHGPNCCSNYWNRLCWVNGLPNRD